MLEGIGSVHLVGSEGIGMSAVGKLLEHWGKTVTRSDLLLQGHASSNVGEGTGLVIYSSAVPDTNVERLRAAELSIPQLSYAQFLGRLSREFSTIVVSGTHGKSTTTAMLGLILEAGGYDPTVIVGSKVPGWEHGNLRIGRGRFLVVEGCEYRANMLELEPEMIVLTNIEADHLDYYRDVDHVRETFQKFVDKMQGKGLVIWNADDPQSNKLKIPNDGVRFGVRFEKVNSPHFQLKIPGAHNQANALAAFTAAMELGIPEDTIRRTLENFAGIWRRFEIVGEWHGATVISDYAHHPTEIAATLSAAREKYPGNRLVLCYQPHQHARTESFFEEFVRVLSGADVLVLPEIYGVAGRTQGEKISSRDLAKKIPGAHYAADLDAAENILRDLVKKDDVLIIMGAGDVDALARKLV